MSWDSFIDPVAEFLGQDAESQVKQGNYKETLDGKYKPGVWDTIWGRANEGQDALDTQKNRDVREKYKPLLEAYDLKWTDGMTTGQAERLLRDEKDRRGTTKVIKDANTVYNLPQNREERRIAAQQRYDLLKQGLEDRIERREDRATEFEYQKMRDRKEDRLYNERMEKLDRKDRILAMQNIAAGLASLGAAFAV